MKIRKYHPHNSVLFVTLSMEQGLLLLANPLCEAIFKSCLSAAQTRYPVTISAFLCNSNHVHMLLVVKNPSDISDFIKYFKTESAHMINRVLGRNKRTIWCKGYDSPVVLTLTRALIAITYLYANPAKDNLVDSIDEYPGMSSWKMFCTREYKKKWKRIRRHHFRALTNDSHNLRGYTKEAQIILSKSKKYCDIIISPNAWIEAFGITDSRDQEQINQQLINRVKTLELRAQKARQRLGKTTLGRHRLINQKLDINYLSNRSGKRTVCISDDIKLRIRFIEFIKGLYEKAKEVLGRWKSGDFSIPFPPGLYPPCMPKLAETISIW